MYTHESTKQPLAKKALGGLIQIVLWVYFAGMALAVPVYNYRFAREYGFFEWLTFGEIVPTFKAVAWPYFVVADRNASILRDEQLAYWQKFVDTTASYAERSDDELIGRVKERTALKGQEAGRALMVEGLSDKVKALKDNLMNVRAIPTPDCYHSLHEGFVSMAQSRVDSAERMIAAIRSHDEKSLQAAIEEERQMTARFEPVLVEMRREMGKFIKP